MNKNIEKELNQFIEAIISEKSLQLSSTNYSFDSLVVGQILKLEKNKYVILDYSKISKLFIEKYKEKFGFYRHKRFIENISFLNKIIQDFKQNKFIPDFHRLKKELWKVIIINFEYKSDFTDFISSLDKQTDNYTFIEAYSDSLQELELSPEIFITNALQILDFLQNDGVQNYLFNGIKERCRIDFEYGIKLFEIALKEDVNDNLLAAIISGLYDNKKDLFYNSYLKDYLKDEKYVNAILWGLSNVREIKETECNLFLELFDRFKDKEETNISRNALLLTLIKQTPNCRNQSNLTKQIFNRLNKEIKKEDSADYILHNITYIDKYPNEKIELLIEFIKQHFFDISKHIQIIDSFFYYLKDIRYLKNILISLADSRPFMSFASELHSIRNINKTDLDNLIIELLISDKAPTRFVGNDIFYSLSSQKSYVFSVDIVRLSTISQYKLWVSLTQSFREPKYYIPALLPLLNSKSDLIKESFICKLEVLSEDYGNLIIEVLEKHLDLTKKENLNTIERIKKYMDEFYQNNITIKSKIKELNPYYTENKYMKLYYTYYNKNMRKVFKEAEKKSILSVIGTTIKLAKGGGWKFGNKNEISKLGKIEHGFALPRSYFINPNLYEFEQSIEMRKDWKDKDFKIIKDFLYNE